MTTTHKRAGYGAVKEAVCNAEGLGLSIRQLSKASGFLPQSVRCAALALGIKLKGERRPLGAVKSLVIEGHERGMTVPQLAETSGVSPHTLYRAANRLGLVFKPARRGPPPR